ncbi:hypothetical protein ACOI7N_20810 [Pseudomonas sp. P2758]|uniref:hypothetical protein n=1 Tax=Pseudomonas sp. P2758 TaxID=3409916 RepID=UPI003B5CDCD7
MGHSAAYQTELHIRQLEQVSQSLFEQGVDFRDAGYDELADAAFSQASQLKRVIVELKKMMEK